MSSTVNPSDFIRRYAIPNLPYLLVFWFANKLGMAYRLSPGDDFLQKFMGSFEILNSALSNPIPSFDMFDLFIGAVGSAIIYAVVYSKKKNAKLYRKDVEYGSARWDA